MRQPDSPARQRSSGADFGLARAALLYLFLAGGACFLRLGEPDVVSMEGIVADAARHMERAGEALMPHLYGEPYFYKPPMLYWAAWLSFRLFGESAWALRLPTALTALSMGLGLLLLVGRRAGSLAGLLAALASLTGILAVQKARIAEFDMLLAAGTGIAVAAAAANLGAERPSLRLWLVAYAGVAFGFFSKGLAVIPAFVPGLLLAALLTGRPRALLSPRHLLPAALCLTAAGAYIFAVWIHHDPAVFEQPLGEARARGFAWGPGEIAEALGRPAVLMVVFFPWTALLPLACSPAWRARLEEPSRRMSTAAWGFLLAGLAALMLVPKVETRYFLPLCAPTAILAGLVLAAPVRDPREGEELSAWRDRRLLALRAGAALAAALALVGGLQTILRAPGPIERVLLVGLGLLALAAAARPPARPKPVLLLPSLAAICVWATLTLVEAPHRAAVRSLRGAAERFSPHLPPDATVWLDTRDDESSLIFYLRRPARTFHRREAWPPPSSYLVLYPGQIEELARVGSPYRVLCRARGWKTDLVLVQLGGTASVKSRRGGDP